MTSISTFEARARPSWDGKWAVHIVSPGGACGRVLYAKVELPLLPDHQMSRVARARAGPSFARGLL
jgi:hypothetical protein